MKAHLFSQVLVISRLPHKRKHVTSACARDQLQHFAHAQQLHVAMRATSEKVHSQLHSPLPPGITDYYSRWHHHLHTLSKRDYKTSKQPTTRDFILL